MSVPVQTTGSTFTAGNPSRVFEGRYFAGTGLRTYDASPDGQRFLMIKEGLDQTSTGTPASLVVVLNWVEELKQRVR